MFGKKISNEYRQVNITFYPDGNVRNKKEYRIDFDNSSAADKYHEINEEFKARSIKAQADIKENETLNDDTLKVTFSVSDVAFTVRSEYTLPNVDYVKALALLPEVQLKELEQAWLSSGDFETLDVFDFEEMIRKVVAEIKDLGTLSPRFIIKIQLHDSYTKAHKNAIESIVRAFVGDNYNKADDQLTIESEDIELRKVFLDLAMNKYYDIEIIEAV